MIRAVALMLAAWLIPLAVVAQSAAPAPAKPALPTVEEPDVLAGQKARVEQERARVQARFAGEEKACRARFLVNACLDEARERRNAELAELRRQDVILGDAERRRRTEEQQRKLDERQSAPTQQAAEERRQKALADQRARQERADSKAEGPKPGGAPRAEGARAGGTPAVVDTQKNASDRAARLKQAQERKERAQQREASRKKPPPQPLPPPPP